ncbi:hypothetical protein [Nodularia sphaerocarpa]|uniref:hypothetical protein n=1 Tax=Nodularia sphaerocarpa TaxID=137816 RepID=UPI001EFAA3E2|nr:hypothetical protein [Nodularia sphaerocarpa]MDB9374978.1 hypothetical protein [Nodularia sphaerocarpa CS-585]MDB9376446.1 hypothetical protein [Nodularia sphaerocarpa CS-585A2]ULP74230.1 hypothetical protein BDGGKGIB_03893 [Nodularia sphaerocarpa UHCC 0038]
MIQSEIFANERNNQDFSHHYQSKGIENSYVLHEEFSVNLPSLTVINLSIWIKSDY